MAVKTFTTGEVLTAADTNTYLNNGGLVYVTSQAIGTGVSTVTVSNCFSSTYDNYRITLGGGTMSVDGSYLRVRFDTGGTTNYYGSLLYDLYTGTNNGYARVNAGAFGDAGITSTEQATTSFDVFGPNLTKRTYVSGVYSAGYIGFFGFQNATTTQHTNITFLSSSGTFTGGTITVYGYRKV